MHGDGVQQPDGQVPGNLGILVLQVVSSLSPLSACMLALFWLPLFGLDSGGENGTPLTSHRTSPRSSPSDQKK